MLDGFEDAYAEVNGIRLHYVSGGEGPPVVLLPGWPRTCWQYHKVMPELARHYRVIAVDLRGMGDSDKPAGGYDKKTMAQDVHELVRLLGYERVNVAGEDIGSMVAYAFAANHPEATEKVALWEPGHPDESFRTFTMLPQPGVPHLWWWALNQVDELPEQLLAGRFRLLVDWMADLRGASPAIDEQSRQIYAAAYDSPDGIRASNGWFKAYDQDIADVAKYPKLTMPVLGLGGLFFTAVKALLESRATDVRLVELEGAGHFIAEENPEELVRELRSFFG
jgi:pimeloyl-ACP methyl ester carboxylesterase